MFTSCSPVASQAFKGALAANSKKRSPCLNFKTSEEKCRLEDDAEDNYSIDTIERKIRRLTTEQVTSLERKFEIENKLEPELKEQLSKELGLQPRQVAIWFQNRRARWKTKQMEKDYDNLKAKYDALKCDHALLLQDKKKLLDQVLRLNEKLQNADGVDSEIENLGSAQRLQAGLTLKAEVLVERSMEDERPGWNLNSTPNKKVLEDQKDLTYIESFPLKTKQDRSWSSYSHDNREIVYVDCSRSNKSAHSMAEYLSFSENTGQESTEQTSFMHFGEDNYLCTVRNLSLAYHGQISAIKSEDIIYQDGCYNHFAVLEDQFPAWWDWP